MGWMNEDGSLSDLAKAGFKSPTQGAGTSLWAATVLASMALEECIVKTVMSQYI